MQIDGKHLTCLKQGCMSEGKILIIEQSNFTRELSRNYLYKTNSNESNYRSKSEKHTIWSAKNLQTKCNIVWMKYSSELISMHMATKCLMLEFTWGQVPPCLKAILFVQRNNIIAASMVKFDILKRLASNVTFNVDDNVPKPWTNSLPQQPV